MIQFLELSKIDSILSELVKVENLLKRVDPEARSERFPDTIKYRSLWERYDKSVQQVLQSIDYRVYILKGKPQSSQRRKKLRLLYERRNRCLELL